MDGAPDLGAPRAARSTGLPHRRFRVRNGYVGGNDSGGGVHGCGGKSKTQRLVLRVQVLVLITSALFMGWICLGANHVCPIPDASTKIKSRPPPLGKQAPYDRGPGDWTSARAPSARSRGQRHPDRKGVNEVNLDFSCVPLSSEEPHFFLDTCSYLDRAWNICDRMRTLS